MCGQRLQNQGRRSLPVASSRDTLASDSQGTLAMQSRNILAAALIALGLAAAGWFASQGMAHLRTADRYVTEIIEYCSL